MAIDFNNKDKGRKYKRHRTNREEHDNRTFTWTQVEDVLTLIENGKRPDGQFSDDECNLWSMITNKLDIDVKF